MLGEFRREDDKRYNIHQLPCQGSANSPRTRGPINHHHPTFGLRASGWMTGDPWLSFEGLRAFRRVWKAVSESQRTAPGPGSSSGSVGPVEVEKRWREVGRQKANARFPIYIFEWWFVATKTRCVRASASVTFVCGGHLLHIDFMVRLEAAMEHAKGMV